MRVEIETCENTPEVCPDGKSPFKVPGECCLGCSEFYLYPQSLYYFKAHFFFSEYLSTARFGPGSDTQQQLFNESNPDSDLIAPPPNTWGEWSSYTECSVSCGGGRQSRMRECMTTGARELDCTGLTVNIIDCNTHHCPSEKQHEYLRAHTHTHTHKLCF